MAKEDQHDDADLDEDGQTAGDEHIGRQHIETSTGVIGVVGEHEDRERESAPPQPPIGHVGGG